MKNLVLLFSLFLAFSAQGAWLTNYDKALELSAQTQKPVLVDFTGSDWCIWCKRLDAEVFEKAAFKDYAAKNLILLKLDFPRAGNQSAEEKAQNQYLAQDYEVEGFPTILLLNSNGDEIARTGYRRGGADAYISHLKELLR